ncbi:MAG TPA: trypsin-like peptidase domain-containing protein [Gemmataceae bacterium]|nr:trypsin-like peptidase domain-containing protein [Gemmataceae bacterium]
MKRSYALALSLTALLGLGAFLIQSSIQGQGVAPKPVPTTMPREAGSYRSIVKQALPAVVSIEAKTKTIRMKGSKGLPNLPPGVPPEFKKFFGDKFHEDEMPDDQPSGGFGSGFFVDASGIILTNAHVVEGADTLTVTTADGRKFSGKGVKFDLKTDLAIVRVDGKGPFPYLELDDSDAYEIGDRVLAVGAPFGLTNTVTSGIISAKGRSDLHMNMYEDFVQTDAAINPGNSGGPLIGLNGKVVGINAAIKSRSGGFQGIGLAVASNLAKNVVRALETDGIVHRGYLGVKLQPESDKGVVVGQVFDGSPAFKAGLQTGDVIASVNGRTVKNGRDLQWMIANAPIKQTVNMDVVRDGKKRAMAVTLAEQPQTFGQAENPRRANSSPSESSADMTKLEKLGVQVDDLSKEQAGELGYRREVSGVVITGVAPNSPAAVAGIRKGQVISKVGDHKVSSVDEVGTALANATTQQGVRLQLLAPDGSTTYVLLRQQGTP